MRQALALVKSFLVKNRLNLSLAIASVVLSLLFAESIFRVYLFRMTAKTNYDHLNFYIQDKSFSEFDEKLGFHYKPNLSVDWSTIKDSLPNTTGTLVFDRRGNSGPDVDDANSDVRIAVAGDSFTVLQHDGITWPYLLQKTLRESTGRKVAVYNYAKDGYGVLQMIDQASSLVEEKPDAILISFISPDMVRSRFWRMELKTSSGVDVFTSTTPTLQFDKPDTYVRTTLVEPRATRKWAEATMATQDRNDPVLRSLLDTYVREKKNYSITRFDPLSFRTLYLWERMVHPRVQPGGVDNAQVMYTNYASDDRFMEGVRKLKRSKIPVYLVHLPWYPDMASGKYVMDKSSEALLNSLKIITGFPLVEILPPTPMGNHADIMILSHENAHPSMNGLNFYALQVAQALRQDSIFGKILNPTSR